MKHVRTLSLLFMISILCTPLLAQGDQSSYQAYLNSLDKELWKKEIRQKSRVAEDEKSRYNLALSQLGLLSSTMADQDEDMFDDHYDAAVDNLETLIKSNKNWAEPKAILSAVYGLKMGYSPFMGMFLGSKSSNLIEKAKAQSPDSPLVWKLYANSKLFTPEMFGGDLDEAIESYEQCIKLYELQPAQLENNWLYLDALAFAGQAYLKKGEKEKAKKIFEKALQAEPKFSWVKEGLLPKAL